MKSLIALAFLLAYCSLQAQLTVPTTSSSSNSTEVESHPAFWQAKFDNGGHYMVKLGNISSASKHEYIANGAARVVEVTVAASGPVVARFYFLEAAGKNLNAGVSNAADAVRSLAQSAANNVATGAGNIQVVKDYPNTTHAHTVEFALQTEASLNSLFQSLNRAVETGKGRTWVETSK